MDRFNAEKEFFRQHLPPDNLAAHEKLACNFINYHVETDRRVVLVTSGGTAGPIQTQSVLYLDNFSRGTRGARCAEYFLQSGYAVIFLHRQDSRLPYFRDHSHSTNCLPDLIDVSQVGSEDSDGCKTPLRRDYEDQMYDVLHDCHFAKEYNNLLLLPFETISDYLFHLRSVTILMQPLGANGLIYLAATVSDFFIPCEPQPAQLSSLPKQDGVRAEDIAATSDGKQHVPPREPDENPRIELKPVPNFLKTLVDDWASDRGMVVSCKMEADPNILLHKARSSLQRYGQHLVVGSLLSTRHREAVFVSPGSTCSLWPWYKQWLRVPESSIDVNSIDQDAVEIAKLIVSGVVKLHSDRI